jgi:hypothetical protein
VANHAHSEWGCALARRTGSRRSLHPSGAFHGGSFPRSIPRLLASPLPSSTFATRPFGAWRGPRGPYDRGARHVLACARDPPDLDADSPVASRSMRSDLPAGLPLLGLSKDRPSIVSEPKSPTPGIHVSVAPFGERQPAVPAIRPRGFAPPRRFAPLRPRRFVAPCFRSWGSPCFFPSRNGPPHGVVPALRSFPSADSGGSGSSPAPRARVTGTTIAGRLLHRAPCPLTLHSVHRERGFPLSRPPRSPAPAARSRGLEALLHRRVRCLHVRCHT